MSRSVQLNLPPSPLNRVESERGRDLNKVEISLEQAKTTVARVVSRTIQRSGSVLKDFGDKGQVGRWCNGTENPNLARLIQRPDVRREFLRALAEEDDAVRVRTVIEIEEKSA